MSSRKPGYLLGILLLAVLCSAPHLCVLFMLASEAVQQRGLPYLLNPNWGQVGQRGGLIAYAAFSGDQFLYLSNRDRVNGVYQWKLRGTDPRTRDHSSLNATIRGSSSRLEILTFGSRVWFIGNGEAFELINGATQPSTMVNPTPVTEHQRFLLDGEPAVIAKSGPRFAISTFETGAWTVSQHLLLPNNQRETVIDGVPIKFATATTATCLNQGDRIHLFLEVGDRLLYRDGLDLQSASGSQIPNIGPPEEPASALNPANATGSTTTWNVINKTPIASAGNNFATRYRYLGTGNKFGLLVNGQPAAMLVDGSDAGTMVGHLFRFDGQKWSEFATHTFPFGTVAFRTVVSQNNQTSFIVATTSTGVVYAYEVDASGVSPTPGNRTTVILWYVLMEPLVTPVVVLVITAILGAFLGLGTGFLMWLCTRSDYGFGTQYFRLAPIVRRGLARAIDLGLMILSTIALGCWLTRDLDWLALTEGLNLQLPHPAVDTATRTLWMLLLWLIMCEALLITSQARWGLTIGKWSCDLRTLRTTLKPCGFARSLVRELVFWVDVCGLLCWTPGIVSIALTEHRQRLGDIVGDTIVVAKPTMK